MPRAHPAPVGGRVPLRRCLALVAALAACDDPPPPPLAAEFLVAAGDSTYWVQHDSLARVRGAPLWLVHHDGRFLELYVVDLDRSHRRGIFVGQQLWQRDLVDGDSSILAADTTPLALERDYALKSPWDPRLRPEDEADELTAIEATSEVLPLDVVGPYLGIELRRDVETADSSLHRHETRRGVVDLRIGRRVSLAEILGVRAGAIVEQGEVTWRRARDSVFAEQSEAGRAASEAINDFPFDPSSFSLMAARDTPAVAFVVPGRGERSGGYVLPLAPIPIGTPAWWTPRARREWPIDADSDLVWRGPAYDVVARADSAGERASIVLRTPTGVELIVARVPLPVRRVWRLDAPPVDAATRDALARAFNDATLYGDEIRTASRAVPFQLVTRR
ncbi:MAG: hypothetical protein SFW08_04975 [Gemmatimonadaceae bacterium]|nr:hypothetical protein [Gemmatimonadaceae bacterium]